MMNDSIHGSTDGLPKEFDLFVKKSLRNITRRVLRAYERDLRRHYAISIEELGDIPGPEAEMDAEKIHVRTGDSDFAFENEMLAAGYESLKDRHKRVLAFFYAMDMPYQAVCELMKLEKKSVKNYKSEALKILRKYCEEDGGDYEL